MKNKYISVLPGNLRNQVKEIIPLSSGVYVIFNKKITWLEYIRLNHIAGVACERHNELTFNGDTKVYSYCYIGGLENE